MQSEPALALAADVLEEHFGCTASRVGRLLMDKGELSLPEILRFSKNRFGSCENELTFKPCRNALLTLVRHRCVEPRAIRADAEGAGMVHAKYRLHVDEVLTRLRFPHFLECVYHQHGRVAYEIVFIVLKYGMVSRQCANTETMQALSNQTMNQIDDAFQKLVALGLLRAVEPLVSTDSPTGRSGGASSSSSSANAGGDSLAITSAGTANQTSAKLLGSEAADVDGGSSSAKHLRVEGEGIAEQPASKQARVDGESGSRHLSQDVVYTFNRMAFNLCVFKNLLIRFVEERRTTKTAQVMYAMLEFVKVDDKGAITSEYKHFQAINDKMGEIGARQLGRDPDRERQTLRTILDQLASNTAGLLRKREVKKLASSSKGPNQSLVQNPAGRSAAALANVLQGTGDAGDELVEWSINWAECKKIVIAATTSKLIRDQFGKIGARIFNLLCEKQPAQKMEESEIFQCCMVPATEGRETLNSMVRRGLLRWQEVPKGAQAPLIASHWLYYVDYQRVPTIMLHILFKTILNFRVRFRVQNAKVLPLETRASSENLTAQDRARLRVARLHEDMLEKTAIAYDACVLIYTCF